MTKIGRNIPCRCGSGLNYKKCCLASTAASDSEFNAHHRLHSELMPSLMEFAAKVSGRGFIEAAWFDFNGTDTVEEYDPKGGMSQLFMPWFLFNCELDSGQADDTLDTDDSDSCGITFAELFLVANAARLTTDEKNFIFSQVRRPYTLCEVVEIKPGDSMTLFDLLRRIRYEVVERSASRMIKKGEIIYCATSEYRGFRSNVGLGPYSLRPTSKLDVLELREWMVNEIGAESIASGHLLEFEDEVRWLYLDLVAERLAPPVLVNYDGHLMVPQKLYFDVDSADEAFHVLKSLAEGEDEGDLLEDAVIENGVVKSAEIPWIGGTKKARKKLGGPVVLGRLMIENRKLVIDVNSTERAKKIRKIVEERLAGHAVYTRTEIEPLEAQMREMQQAATAGGSPVSGSSSHADQMGFEPVHDSEVLRMIEEMARQFWEAWFDEPVPALDNMTPRQAAKTKKGRDLLSSLLLEYENNASTVDDIVAPDMKALRTKLGM